MRDKNSNDINRLKSLLNAYQSWKITKQEFDKRRTIWNYCI